MNSIDINSQYNCKDFKLHTIEQEEVEESEVRVVQVVVVHQLVCRPVAVSLVVVVETQVLLLTCHCYRP